MSFFVPVFKIIPWILKEGLASVSPAPIWVRAGTIFLKKRCLLSLERIPVDVSFLRQTLRHAGMDMFSEEFEEIDVAFQSPGEKS